MDILYKVVTKTFTLDPQGLTDLTTINKTFTHYYSILDPNPPVAPSINKTWTAPYAKFKSDGTLLYGWRLAGYNFIISKGTYFTWYADDPNRGKVVLNIQTSMQGFLPQETVDLINTALINDSSSTLAPVRLGDTYAYYLSPNGGAWAGQPPNLGGTYAVSESNRTLTTVTCYKNGYTLKGWYYSGYSHPQYPTISAGTVNSVTLQAQWEIANYTITYENLKGTSHNNPTSYTIESSSFTLSAPVGLPTGYTYAGWFTSLAGGSQVTSIPTGSTGNRTIYARWTPINYNLYFYLGDAGGLGGEHTNPSSYTIETPTFYLQDGKNRNYYNFAGWYNNGNFTGDRIIQVFQGSTGHRSFYAKWTPIEYTITYDTGGGSHTNPGSYNYETSTFTFTNAARAGYVFKGWFTSSDFDSSSAITQIDKGSHGNKTLYAKWEAIQYELNYFPNGGTALAKRTFTIESPDYTLLTPTRTGYTFAGWYDNSDLTGDPIESIAAGTIGNINVYAKWTSDPYTITYNENGGSECADITYNIESETFALCTTSFRTGYSFAGWYDNAGFSGSPVTQIVKGSSGNKTFYAKWDLVTYYITYSNVPAGVTNNNATEYNYETEIQLQDLSRTGYTFDGWYLQSQYIDKITSIPINSTGNKTFYAKWIINNYNITYNLNSGTNNNDNPANYNIETPTFTFKNPSRNGYTFKGWYTSSSFNEPAITQVIKGSTGALTIYAKWEKITYNLIYALNGGIGCVNRTYDVETDTFDLCVPTRNGYTFKGWYDNSGFNGPVIAQVTKGSYGNKTFYAKWTINNYNIMYNLNGGIGCTNRTYTINDTPLRLCTSATKEGRTFAGWYVGETKYEEITSSMLADYNLVAQWTTDTYTIIYYTNGGTHNNPGTYSVDTNTFELSAAAKTGYTFKNWYGNSNFSGSPITQITKGSTGNLLLYAKYELIPYSITYELNAGGESAAHSNQGTYNIESNTFPLLAATKTGHNFKGWYDNASFTGNPITQVVKGSYGDRTLYAKWEIRKAPVILYNKYIMRNGATYNVKIAEKTFEYKDPISFANITESLVIKTKQATWEYKIKGWTKDATAYTKDDQSAVAVAYLYDNNAGLSGAGAMDPELTKGGTYYAVWSRTKAGLRKNNKKVKIYKGSVEIKRIAKGNTIIWQKDEES